MPIDEESIRRLDHARQVAFCLAIAERLQPAYERFSHEQAFGDGKALRVVLDRAWNWLLTKGPVDVESAVAICDAQAPSPDEFDSLFVSAALDATNAVRAVIELIENPSSDAAIEASVLATDSVDLYVQELEGLNPTDPQLEAKIAAHPLMRAEEARQREDVMELEQQVDFADLRDRWRRPKTGNLGV